MYRTLEAIDGCSKLIDACVFSSYGTCVFSWYRSLEAIDGCPKLIDARVHLVEFLPEKGPQ